MAKRQQSGSAPNRRQRTPALPMLLSGLLIASSCSSQTQPQSQPDLPATTDTAETTPAGPSNVQVVDGVSLRFGTLTERSVDIDANGENTSAVIDAVNRFTVDLYNTVLESEKGSFVLSPYSVATALSMIYGGAEGQTATEMATVLHAGGLDQADWHEGLNAFALSLDARTTESPTEWTAANKVWTQPGLPLRTEYLDLLTGAYDSPLAEAAFTADPEGERAAINGWVAGQTNDLIPELFPARSIDPQTAMVLVNAVALDAPWAFPFDPESTENLPFTQADGSKVSVPTMRYDEFLPTAETETWRAVELPYAGGVLSMMLIVPNDLGAYEAGMTAESLTADLGKLQDGGIHLTVPKWTARTHLSLEEALSILGMPTAFSQSADFDGMVEHGGLTLGLVEHEAFIEVDEEGTRAAAATGGGMVASHGPTINVDRPFVYVIRDTGSGAILFIGRVTSL